MASVQTHTSNTSLPWPTKTVPFDAEVESPENEEDEKASADRCWDGDLEVA